MLLLLFCFLKKSRVCSAQTSKQTKNKVLVSQQPIELISVKFSNSKQFVKDNGNLRVIRKKKKQAILINLRT